MVSTLISVANGIGGGKGKSYTPQDIYPQLMQTDEDKDTADWRKLSDSKKEQFFRAGIFDRQGKKIEKKKKVEEEIN